MDYPIVHLRSGKERLQAARHPWIFDGAVDAARARDVPAGPVRLATAAGEVIGVGTYNPRSAIAVRLFAFEERPLNRGFFEERLAAALALRRRVLPPDTDAFRLVNAEGDGLPGLVVDSFAGHLVIQLGTPGIRQLEDWWLPALEALVRPVSVRLAANQSAANREHMETLSGPLVGEPPDEIRIQEAGVPLLVDAAAGQKTGFFCDQRENRRMVGALARGQRVLDGCAYTGAFSAHALRGGAAALTAVESSPEASTLLERNLALAGGAPARVVRADCAAFLRETDETYDIVVLDPPALAKRRQHVDQAARLYKDLFLGGLKRIRPAGGYLMACSCSAAVDRKLFDQIVFAAAKDARREVRSLFKGGAGPDHPVSVFHPEGEYLKVSLLAVR